MTKTWNSKADREKERKKKKNIHKFEKGKFYSGIFSLGLRSTGERSRRGGEACERVLAYVERRISLCFSFRWVTYTEEDEFPQLKLVTITIQMIIMSGMPLDGYVHSEQCQMLFISKACSAESRLRPQTITVSKYHLLLFLLIS